MPSVFSESVSPAVTVFIKERRAHYAFVIDPPAEIIFAEQHLDLAGPVDLGADAACLRAAFGLHCAARAVPIGGNVEPQPPPRTDRLHHPPCRFRTIENEQKDGGVVCIYSETRPSLRNN
jgi:hypothetical protein